MPLTDSFLAAATDCAIFAQNVALAAESLGLGVCYVGNLRNDPEYVARELNLPPGAMVVFGMTIGHVGEKAVAAVRPRLPQEAILHRESYSTDAEQPALARYDRIFAAHEAAQRRPAMTWSARHRDRFASAAYLAGREKLRDRLRRLGLPLA